MHYTSRLVAELDKKCHLDLESLPPTGVVQLVDDYWGFTTSQVQVLARTVIAIFGKSQKPIEPGVCVSSEFPSSGSSWWYPWAYLNVPWGVGQWLPHTSPLFFPLKKKKDLESLRLNFYKIKIES